MKRILLIAIAVLAFMSMPAFAVSTAWDTGVVTLNIAPYCTVNVQQETIPLTTTAVAGTLTATFNVDVVANLEHTVTTVLEVFGTPLPGVEIVSNNVAVAGRAAGSYLNLTVGVKTTWTASNAAGNYSSKLLVTCTTI
jgi:hypothetical protein